MKHEQFYTYNLSNRLDLSHTFSSSCCAMNFLHRAWSKFACEKVWRKPIQYTRIKGMKSWEAD